MDNFENGADRDLEAHLSAVRQKAPSAEDLAKARAQMGNFVDAFNKITKATATKLVESAKKDPELSNALKTLGLGKGGVVQEKFAIFPSTNKAGKTRYDIANLETKTTVTENLFLHDTAMSIVKLLNRGHDFYSLEVKEVLDLEQLYIKHYNDMLVFKRQHKEPGKNVIAETRFEDAKDRAIKVKERLASIAKSL